MRQVTLKSAARRLALCALAAITISGTARAQTAVRATKPEPVPAASATPATPGIAQFLAIRTPQAPVLADGFAFFRDWPNGVNQIFRTNSPILKDGSAFDQFTAFKDGASSFSVSPDGLTVIIAAAEGGNENTQIYFTDAQQDEKPFQVHPILQGAKVQFGVQHWLRFGSGFVYTANDTSPSDFHLYRWDFGGNGGGDWGKSTKLLAKSGSWSSADATDDATKYLIAEFRSISDTSLYVLTASSGDLLDITRSGASEGHASTIGAQGVGFMPDQNKVLLISDAIDGRPRLFMRDLTSAATTSPILALDAFEVDSATMNSDRTFLAVVTNEDGYGVLHVYRLPNFEPVAMPPIDKGVVGVASLRKNRLTWTLSNAQTPGVSFAYEIPEASAAAAPKATQLTFPLKMSIDLAAFPLPELVGFKSFDGVEIPAFVYLPPGHIKGTPIPFVVNYHGGPEGQFRPSFNATIQYLVSRGFGVMQPNVRGSTGYGRAFHMMDDYKKRWDSVRDGVDAAKWLVDNGYAAPGRIATWGGSYGGFMSVATLVEDQERVERGEQKQRLFGAGINIVGIVNMQTFLEQTSGYRRKLREAEYGPLSDPQFLQSVSPLNRVNKIKVPMMIAHGLNDPRVPIGEAMQLAIALQARGDDPELIYFPDEGHGFAKLKNRIIFSERMVKFLNETIAKK